ncbi:unnamed protein product [Bursaphelenchus okinawaensis]|uniref:Uncharacterized protein n=1 Tax=Bursaphelenchus okinawaensis TaxID=465554 RepID=A0A811JPY2_9BILA|nr:unnamed protein product [Bursaphelenchus okinawaensis]CAG9076974.1 unnamed protein product [Bursaphelenchus okinawaensis]
MGNCASQFESAKAKLQGLNALNDGKKKESDMAAANKVKEKKAKIAVDKIALTEDVVQEYIELEKQIYRFEYKNVLKKYESKTIFADEIKKTVDQLEATFKELKKQTEKERADVENMEQPSVKSFLKQQGTWDERVEKEKQEYMNALNKQEVAEKELKGARLQYERAAKIADIYKSQVDQLNELYDKQDRMLIGIFGPNYASDKENTLEAELDDAMEWQQRVSLAKFKWTNGRVLLVHASTQMAFGITRWKELEEIETGNTRMRYFAAAEARNNFIAASQNVQSCRVYLGRVRFPYATEEEMNLMEQTIHTSFSDIQSNASLKRALTVYQNTHKKVAALIQWFDKVINDTILKDLEKANTNVGKKQKQLREERLNLMKLKYKEEFNKELKVDYDKNIHDETDEELLSLEAEQVKDQQELPGEDLKDILNLSQPEGKNPTPLPLTKLAPIPTKDALFGDVKKKMSELDQTRSSIQQRNNAMKEKTELALQEKLKLRQQQGRRTRPQRANAVIVPLPSLSDQADANVDGDKAKKKKKPKNEEPKNT